MRPKVIRYRPKLIHVPMVRRVLVQGTQFRCGLCHKSHSKQSEAYICLSECWLQFLMEPPLVRRIRRGGGAVLRCRLCGKHYHHLSQGMACARRCIRLSDIYHVAILEEESSPELSDNPNKATEQRKSSHAMSRRFISRLQWKRQQAALREQAKAAGAKPLDSSAKTPAPHSTEQSHAIEAVKPAPNPPEVVKVDTRRRKDSFKQPWHRDQAKYVCECCSTYFYTKMEANECFEGHFDPEGFELQKTQAAG